MEGVSKAEYLWNNQKITAKNGKGHIGKTTYDYDDKGTLTTMQLEQREIEEYEFLLTTYTYSNYEYDEQGNWINRSVKKISYEIDDVGRKKIVKSKSFSEKRTIVYY